MICAAPKYYLYSLNFPNGKKYIGITKNPKQRRQNHLRASRRKNSRIYEAIRKHGMPPLQLLCVGLLNYITDLEIKAIDRFQTRERAFGYNVAFGGNHSPITFETRAKIGAARRGHKQTTEQLAKLSAVRKGRKNGPPSLETREKIGAAQRGRKLSPKQVEQIRAMKTGVVASPETRAKMRASQIARRQKERTAIFPAQFEMELRL